MFFFLETVPDEVENLQFEDISDRALTVKWSPPKETNGILMHYQLKYMIKKVPDSLHVENFTADVLSVKVEHLQVVMNVKIHMQHKSECKKNHTNLKTHSIKNVVFVSFRQ